MIQSDEMKSLQRFPGLQAKILATVDASLDEYRKKSREFVTHLVKMEGSLVIPQLFKVAEEQFGMDKQNMGSDAEYGKVQLSSVQQAMRPAVHVTGIECLHLGVCLHHIRCAGV